MASDLGAFRRVLDDGALGVLFPAGDPAALAAALLAPARRTRRERARLSRRGVQARCAATTGAGSPRQVLAVYETVRLGADRVGEDVGSRRLLTRWRG